MGTLYNSQRDKWSPHSYFISVPLPPSLSPPQVFPDLKFRYVEEDQPEEFFVPYVWTIVFKSSPLHWDHSKIHFTTS